MFDLVTKHKRIAQVILALLVIPFAFVGVDYYFRRDATTTPIATVGGAEVTRAEFDELVRQQQDRMRQTMGRAFDPAIFDNPEVRYSLVEQLVSQRLLQKQAQEQRFRVTDADLARAIGEIEAFRVDGKFSPERYRQLLAAQNMTPAMFEQRLREELILAPLSEPLASGNIVAKSSAERFVALLEQQREVAAATVDAEPYAIEYVMLTLPALSAKVTVDPAEVRKQYDDNIKSYSKAEERGASHILVAVKPGASDADKAAAKDKAERLAKEVRASPARFAELAKANSDDPGSAAQGGDLGTFARGSMVKAFEDAVFAAKSGDIVGPVETEFGYHVIRVTGIEGGRTRSFDEVKAEIEQDMKRNRAQAQFAQSADQLQNIVYEQADSLAPAAKALGVEVVQTPLVTRSQVQQLALGNAKFVQALFSPESIQGKRNTDAIEVGPNALMSGRIVEYKAAAPRPFDEVKEEIRRQLVVRGASEMAQKAGRDKLALLEQGKSDKESGVAFGKPVALQRGQAQPGFSPDAVNRIFQANATKLPAYVGATNDRGGFSIYKVLGVTTPPAGDAAKAELAGTRISEQLGRELVNAYLASLKAKAEVKIDQAALEKK